MTESLTLDDEDLLLSDSQLAEVVNMEDENLDLEFNHSFFDDDPNILPNNQLEVFGQSTDSYNLENIDADRDDPIIVAPSPNKKNRTVCFKTSQPTTTTTTLSSPATTATTLSLSRKVLRERRKQVQASKRTPTNQKEEKLSCKKNLRKTTVKNDAKETGGETSNFSNLLTKKDEFAENFLSNLMEHVRGKLSSQGASSNLSPDEYRHFALNEAGELLHNSSIMLSHKFLPIIKTYITEEYNSAMHSGLATVTLPDEPIQLMAKRYFRCFKTFIESENCISFATGNKNFDANSRVTLRDLFVLTLFAMVTCKRTKNDNMLQLILSGITSCGKSTLFENVLMQGAHSLATEGGCGRFDVGKKNVLLLHDINLRYLVGSPDTEKFKTLCRTETTNVKIHSTTITVPAIFLFATMNQRLQNHTYPEDGNQIFSFRQRNEDSNEVNSQASSLNFFDEDDLFTPKNRRQDETPSTLPFPTTATTTTTTTNELVLRTQQLRQQSMSKFLTGGQNLKMKTDFSDVRIEFGEKRQLNLKNTIEAMQNRFLECNVRKKPLLDSEDLLHSGSFTKAHMIVGTFEYMISILEKYKPEDFYTPMVYRYVLAGLCKNLTNVLAIQDLQETRDSIDARLAQLVHSYSQTKEEVESLFLQVE
jgi:hypothetical protein